MVSTIKEIFDLCLKYKLVLMVLKQSMIYVLLLVYKIFIVAS